MEKSKNKIQNELSTKSEYLNSKQSLNSNFPNSKPKFKTLGFRILDLGFRISKFCISILIFAFCILNFIGCTTIIEGAKGIAGISTKVLEDNRKNAIRKTFNCNYNTCYNKTKRVLINIGSYIYGQSIKKQMFAVYLSEEDTTPVGIFFKVVDANNTQIEVSSPSIYAKEYIAGKLFPALGKSLKLEDQKGKTDAKQEVADK